MFHNDLYVVQLPEKMGTLAKIHYCEDKAKMGSFYGEGGK